MDPRSLFGNLVVVKSKKEHFLSWIPQSKKVSTPWKIPSKPVADLWNLGWLIQKDRRMWRAPICIIYQLCLFSTKTQKRHFYKVFEPHKRTTGSKAFGSIAKKYSTSQTSPIRFLLFSWSNLSGHFHKGGPDRDKGNQRDHRFPPHFALILYLSSWLDVVLKCLWKTCLRWK